MFCCTRGRGNTNFSCFGPTVGAGATTLAFILFVEGNLSWHASGFVKTLTHHKDGTRLSAREKLILFVLADSHNETRGNCAWLGIEKAAHDALTSRSRFLELLKRLEENKPHKAIVGRNAFAHEAGIHQDGMIKDPSTYEIIAPHSVGAPRNSLVLGKHSGRNALRVRYEKLGFTFERAQLDDVYRRFVALAGTRSRPSRMDIYSSWFAKCLAGLRPSRIVLARRRLHGWLQ